MLDDGSNLMAGKRKICENLAAGYRLDAVDKAVFLTDKAGAYLFSHLPGEISSILRKGFWAGLPGDKVDGWQSVLDYFRENSEIIPALIENPGTYTMLERMYHLHGVRGVIDNYFLLSVAGGQALRNRYLAINRELVALIASLKCSSGKCLVADFGSGPGRNLIDILSENPALGKGLIVDCIDRDVLALRKGMELAAEKNIEVINFVEADMLKLNGRYHKNIDLGLLIGVLCGMNYRWRVVLLKKLLNYSRPGGKLVAAALLDKMAQKDLLCSYILRETAFWHLEFRPFGELRKALEEAGWKYQGCFHDEPTNLYEIAIAVAP